MPQRGKRIFLEQSHAAHKRCNRRHGQPRSDFVLRHKFCRSHCLRLRYHVQRSPSAPRGKHVVHGKVERNIRRLGHPIIMCKRIILLHDIQKLMNRSARDHHSFRNSSAPRRVKNVRDSILVRSDRAIRQISRVRQFLKVRRPFREIAWRILSNAEKFCGRLLQQLRR